MTVKNDLALLSNEDVDLLISRVEVTASNQESYQLSSVYYQDPVMLMTKNGATLDLSSSETKIGVIPNATIKPMLTDYLTTMGYPALITDISSYPDALDVYKRQLSLRRVSGPNAVRLCWPTSNTKRPAAMHGPCRP